MRTRRVTQWESGSMVLRWAAASFLSAEQNFRRVSGYKDLWMLSVALGRSESKKEEGKEASSQQAA